jgi:hypothetical protein
MIEPMLALSTGHLSEDTCNRFLKIYDGPCWEKGDYGWFVYVPEAAGEDDLPEDLAACFAFAILKGCCWVMFDRDAAPVDELPFADW